MQGQYSGVSPTEVSLSLGSPPRLLWALGLCPLGWVLLGMPVLGGAGCQCPVPGGDRGPSAVTPNAFFLLFPLPGQMTKLQQLSGHTLPFASLGHAPSMVPGEHLLCPPQGWGCGVPLLTHPATWTPGGNPHPLHPLRSQPS